MLSIAKRDVPFDVTAAFDLLIPPSRFNNTRFDNYFPNPNYESQSLAKKVTSEFILTKTKMPRRTVIGSLGLKAQPKPGKGLYLDGGFGVGKTHLLGSMWQACTAPKAFISFVDLVNVVGAFGFEASVEKLSELSFLAIDEFELDDPGDTVLISNLLNRIIRRGVDIATTSNTLPDKLGQGRFAADDFLREIQGLAAHFEVLTIDGPDYRATELHIEDEPRSSDDLVTMAASMPNQSAVSSDSLFGLLEALTRLHPIMYSRLLEGLALVIVTEAKTIDSLAAGLRFVTFTDRAYEHGIPIMIGDTSLNGLFSASILSSGYRKKFGRALSRLSQLRDEGERVAAPI
ncbi:cell division protein ZapE [Acidithrix sp. C25]|uniref:cell division protein ZapE n=1 Tax=Acidithrix sp. C25 TaxID=1671482 RepID=UPI00191BBD60|nr:cell division protein ZapE [Acidithrix sp. C25]CAG4921159.1 unnamed protein product [Acidithrix sp. C25]